MKKWKIIIGILLIAVTIQAQNPLEVIIELNLDNPTVEQILNEISRKSDVRFSYSKNLLPDKQKNIDFVGSATVATILARALKYEGLSYNLIGGQIVIYKKEDKEEKPSYTFSGYIEDAKSGERLIGAYILDYKTGKGTTSNNYGFYSLTLEEGEVNISVTYLGYEPAVIRKEISKNNFNTLKLVPNLTLAEIIVKSSEHSENTGISVQEINLAKMDLLPTMIGETDLLRTINTMPGIQSGTEGLGGLNVRGGDFDQNLIMLDDAPIYNPIHTWGIYSVFNSSAVQKARIFKSGFPAQYGGRLSSVIDVRTKDGNKLEHKQELELGLISLKGSAEGPILKNKASYFISGRRSLTDMYEIPYSQVFLERENIRSPELKYYFYDVNLKLNYSPSKYDRFQFSFYDGKDQFTDYFESSVTVPPDSLISFTSDEKQNWGNTLASFRYNRTLSEKIFANFTATFSRFRFESRDTRFNRLTIFGQSGQSRQNAYGLTGYNSNISDKSLKLDFDYYAAPERTFRFGMKMTEYKFQPGIFSETTDLGFFENPDSLQRLLDTLWTAAELKPKELSGYFEYRQRFKKLNIVIGVNSGLFFPNGETRYYFDPRFKLQWEENDNYSFGFDFQIISQFTHLISPNRFGLPNDIWVSSTQNVKPKIANTNSAWFRFQPYSGTKVNIELYHKSMKNLIEFSSSRSSRLNASDWEEDLVTGRGNAHGAEFMIDQDFKFFQASANYTLAFSNRQFDDLNGGNVFRFRYDRRHVLNASVIKKINKKWSVSASYVFATGLATTLPRGTYVLPGFPLEITVVGDRNALSFPNFHHLDIGAVYNSKSHQIKFGIHNVYYKKNILNYEIGKDNKLFQRIFPPILPSFSYILKR